MQLYEFLKNNFGNLILTSGLFVITFLSTVFFKCIGGSKYLCGPPVLDFVTHLLGWPLIFFGSSLSHLLGKSIFTWIALILFFVIQFLYLYLLVYLIDVLINKLKVSFLP